MSYQVFARKYRPRTFDDVVGQDHITQTLKNAIAQNRLAHAYLFVGPRGTGKTSTARILSKALNCTGGPKVDFDPDEDICLEIAEGRSMDVLEIDGASNNGVEQIRELRENVRFAPARGKYKIYIIDEVHMLTPGAFNALLKTLEEPPAHVKFIFATTEPQKVLPTILSRCQRFDLRRIPANLIAEHLKFIAKKEKIKLDEAAAQAIAKGAEGGLRDAESMLDQLVAFCGDKVAEEDVLSVFGFTSQQVVSDLCGHIMARETAPALELVHQQSEAGKDLMKLMSDLIGHLRNLLVFQVDEAGVRDEISGKLRDAMRDQAAAIPPPRLLDLVDQFAAAEGRMKWAPNKKLHFEIALIKAIQTLDQTSLDDVLDSLAALRGGGGGTPPTQPKPAAPARRIARPEPPESGSQGERAPRAQTPPRASQAQAAAPKTEDSDEPVSNPGSTRVTEGATSPPVPAQRSNAGLPALKKGSQEPAPPVPDPGNAPERVLNQAPDPAVSAKAGRAEELLIALVHRLKGKPLIHACLLKAVFLGEDEREFRIGFSPDDRLTAESLLNDDRRALIEELLEELTGTRLRLQCEVRDGIEPKPVPAAETTIEKNLVDEFKNDEKIRAALELFKGQLSLPGES